MPKATDLPLPSGSWSPLALRYSAGRLSDADLKNLREKYPDLKKAARKDPLADALLQGLAEAFRLLYTERWCLKTRRPESALQPGKDLTEAYREAALFCFQNALAPARYLACAEETFKQFLYPTPQHIKGPFLKRAALDWLAPAERVLQQDTGSAAAGPLEQAAQVFYRVYLARRWPGLYQNA